jgi:hypothetical protein
MEQSFQLKQYGNLSLFEQEQLTAEDRGWWMRRLQKEHKDRQESEQQQMRSAPKPRIPSIPRR